MRKLCDVTKSEKHLYQSTRLRILQSACAAHAKQRQLPRFGGLQLTNLSLKSTHNPILD